MSMNMSNSIIARKRSNQLVYWMVCLFSFLAMIPLFLILWDVVSKGYKNFNLNLLTEVTPSSMDALLANMNGDPIPGGILNGITGSILIVGDRKSTRLNSSHVRISYAVFCLKK